MFMEDSGGEYCLQLIGLLEMISTNQAILTRAPEIANGCQNFLSRLRAIKKTNQRNWELVIRPNLKILLTGENLCGPCGETHMAIGGTITVKDNKLVEQSIAVCLIHTPYEDPDELKCKEYASIETPIGESEIVRRFHFDIDLALDKQDRPISHLQYGGDFSSDHVQFDQKINYRLYKAIDGPRLPSPPYNLTLILDLFLAQFETNTSKLRKEPRWRNLVKQSEKFWLGCYFENLHSSFSDDNTNKTLYEYLCEIIEPLSN